MASLHQSHCTCAGSLGQDTRDELLVLEQVQTVLDEAKDSTNTKLFDQMFGRSFKTLFELCEKHWYRKERESLEVVSTFMERWITKFKFQGKSLVCYYLCKAMTAQEGEECVEYLDKAVWVAEEQVFNTQYLLVKIYLVKGDLFARHQPQRAVRAYNRVISICQKNPVIFSDAENSLQLKSQMAHAYYKLAMLSRGLEGSSATVLEHLSEAIGFGKDAWGKGSHVCHKLKQAYKKQKQRFQQAQRIEQHTKRLKKEEPYKILSKRVEIGQGESKRQFSLLVNYLKGEQQVQILLQDNKNNETIQKFVAMSSQNEGKLQNLGKNLEGWISVDSNLRIYVDQENMRRIYQGQTFAPLSKQKGLILKIIKNHEIYRSTNYESGSSDSELNKQVDVMAPRQNTPT